MDKSGNNNPTKASLRGVLNLGTPPTLLRGTIRTMSILLFIAAVVLAIWGIVALIHGSILLGIVLLVVACLVGPGGYSIFRE